MSAPALALADCFHCGEAVLDGARWVAQIDGVARAMCCPGCAAAAETIVATGCADWYASRSDYAAHIDDVVAPELDLLDLDENAGEGSFTIEGMRCAACVWLIERRMLALDGVLAANLNVSAERLHLRWDPARCRVSQIVRALRAIGYLAYPYDAQKHGEQLERARRTLFRQLFIAGLSMMQVMMYAVPVYLAEEGSMDADMTALMGWASLLLTLPAMLYSAQPFFVGAWRDLRRGLPGMDVPVALGIGAAFVASCVAQFTGTGDLYFDAVTMFIFLLLASRYAELGARRRAAQTRDRLQQGLPAASQLLPDYPASRQLQLVPANSLRPGDCVLVAPGAALPADGVIVEGTTEVDLSLLTGETRTRRMGPGDTLPGGAVNVAQAIVLRVATCARESTMALLVRLVERAGQAKPALALWADRVAAWSVAALLLFAVLVFIGWQLVDPARAWPAAIAVLVVSCPCALSLATPTALAAATDQLLGRGVLTLAPHTLETLARATHIVFDKTGTLTLGRPQLQATRTFGVLDRKRALQIAAALEAGNAHPLALALGAAAGAAQRSADALRYVVGQGLEGELDGQRYRLGSAAFVAQLAGTRAPHVGTVGVSTVWLAGPGRWLACFELADRVRPEAAEVVARFIAAGKTVLLLSGDDQASVQSVADQLGLAVTRGNQLPADKLAFVQDLQASGAIVAMVGDGQNDAAVLRGADVSFALGSGAALAQLHADGVLLGDSLLPLASAADTAKRTLRIIRQNLLWASVYNLVAIPAAASGLLNPWLLSIGMAASSAIVVANALRLRS